MIKMLKPRAQLSSMVEVTAVKCTGITVKHIWHCEPMARFAPDQNRKWRRYGSPLKPWWTFVQITPQSQGLRSRVVAWHAAYSACVSWSARTLASYPGISPGIPLNVNLWRRMARNRKTSARPIDSPMQRRFPSPNTNTFSPSTLFRSVPSAVRNRSGLKLDGSFHSSLQEETDGSASLCTIYRPRLSHCEKLTGHGWLATGLQTHRCLWEWNIHWVTCL